MIKTKYNDYLDILHIDIKEISENYGEERERGVVYFYDYKTNKLISIDIWYFKERMKNNEEISLSVNINIDLDQIYKEIK